MTDAEGEDGPTVLVRPEPAAAAAAVREALAAGRAVSLAGPCEVETAVDRPDGAADARRRHVLAKPDGTLVVHGGAGADPVATLDAPDGLEAEAAADGLRVGAADAGWVGFEAVELLAPVPLAAGAATDGTAGAHASLRERLLEEPGLVAPGFTPLATERQTPAGPVDLFGRDADGRAVVVEVKAHRAGPAAVGQLERYVSALRRDLHADAAVRGVLVAPSATDRARRLLADRGFDLRVLPPGERG